MKKYKVGIIIGIGFLIGLFSITISIGDFFFSTKYYKTPIEAHNDGSTYNAIYGGTKVRKEIGICILDNETCLFIGEIDENRFIVDEMIIKNDRYASKGTIYFYDIRESSDGANSNMTNTSGGHVKWAVMYSQEEVERLFDVASIESYECTNGYNIYLVLYKS